MKKLIIPFLLLASVVVKAQTEDEKVASAVLDYRFRQTDGLVGHGLYFTGKTQRQVDDHTCTVAITTRSN